MQHFFISFRFLTKLLSPGAFLFVVAGSILFIVPNVVCGQPPASKILASPKPKPTATPKEVAPKEVAAQKSPLTLENVSKALRSDKAGAAQKNQILLQAVRQRGISFALTAEIEEELTALGAGKPLLEQLRKESDRLTSSAFYYRDRGDDYRLRRNYDEAIANYGKAIELDAADATAYNNRGLSYAALKRYDEAIADFTKVIELDPTNRNGFHNRGVIFYQRNEFDRAIDDYTRAIDIDPNFTAAYLNRANAHQVMGRKDLAEADRQKARELQR